MSLLEFSPLHLEALLLEKKRYMYITGTYIAGILKKNKRQKPRKPRGAKDKVAIDIWHELMSPSIPR